MKVMLAYLVDFDGTISSNDITSLLAKRFAGPAAAQIYSRYRQGEIGMRGWLKEIAGHFPADLEKLLSAACEAAAFTPGFAQFAGFARAAGRPLYIASDGFGFYIKPILKRHGYLEYITAIYSNNLRLGDNGRVTIEIPYANHRCSVCGNCKAAHVCSLKEEGYRVVYIGNGLNDRFGAAHADLVFARAGDPLADFFAAQQMAFHRFNDFYEIIAFDYPENFENRNIPLCSP